MDPHSENWYTVLWILTQRTDTQYYGSSHRVPSSRKPSGTETHYPWKWWRPPPLMLVCQGYQTEQLPTVSFLTGQSLNLSSNQFEVILFTLIINSQYTSILPALCVWVCVCVCVCVYICDTHNIHTILLSAMWYRYICGRIWFSRFRLLKWMKMWFLFLLCRELFVQRRE